MSDIIEVDVLRLRNRYQRGRPSPVRKRFLALNPEMQWIILEDLRDALVHRIEDMERVK